uniref:Uncharacterized protein n=1 Tax=Panagrolaimus sp. ES5 TaxID=591445 RepID=A0AC34GG05_9BILA
MVAVDEVLTVGAVFTNNINIACLLSALKANLIPYYPATIKLALSNTAFLPDENERLGFGNGIIQINSAFEYFKTFAMNLLKIIFPKVFLNGTFDKGIAICKKDDRKYVYDYCINVKYPKNIPTKKQISWVLQLIPANHKHIEYSKIVSKNSVFNGSGGVEY